MTKKNTITEYEKFFDEIKHLNSKSSNISYITIPKKLVTAMGLNKGDQVRILINKITEEDTQPDIEI